MEGWIKIHRKITEWEWFSEPATRDVFIYLLLMANHKDGRWKGVDVKRGEHITGRKELAKKLGFSEQQIRSAITKLKSTNEITTRSTNRFSIIKLNKYDDYQIVNHPPNQQPTNKQPTDNQQITTNNKDKKEKNDNNEKKIIQSEKISLTPSQIAKQFFNLPYQKKEFIKELVKSGINKEFAEQEIHKFHDYWTEPSRSGAKQKWEQQETFEVGRRLKSWFRNSEKFNPSQKKAYVA